MPTNRTKRTRQNQALDYWKIDQLVTGTFLIAGVGYAAMHSHGCSSWTQKQWDELHDAIRDDWAQCGASFMAWWRGETERFTAVYSAMGQTRDPSVTPWALAQFGEPSQ